MNERHDPIDDVRLLPGIDREKLASSWADSEAKKAIFEEITAMPVETAQSRRGSRVPKRRLIPAVAIVIIMLGGVGAYAAGTYLGEAVPNSPWITTEEAAERVPEFADDIPIPEGRDFRGRSHLYLEMGEMGPGRVQVASVPERMADDAVCMWLDEWLIAHDAGDSRQAATALEVIEESPDWPHWTVNNAETIPTRIRELGEAARTGDTHAVSHELGLNCAPYTTAEAPISPTQD